MNGAMSPLPPYAFVTCTRKTLPFALNHVLLDGNLGKYDTDHMHVTSVTASGKHMVAPGTVKSESCSFNMMKIELKFFPVKAE